MMNEIRADEETQESGALQNLLNLPSTTSSEYLKGCLMHLEYTLKQYPPRKPSQEAIQLVQTVGSLQDFIERHGYVDNSTNFDAYEIFKSYIQQWIDSSCSKMKRGIAIIEEAGPAELLSWQNLIGEGDKMTVVPLIESLLHELQKQLTLFKPIVVLWPIYSVEIESVSVDVLRTAVAVASKHCGLVQISEPAMEDAAPGKRRISWRWNLELPKPKDNNSIPLAVRKGTNLYQVLLLNTLRRLLTVVPQIEKMLLQWSQETPCSDSIRHVNGIDELVNRSHVKAFGRVAADDEDMGAKWAQLVKELRTEYYACITLTAESIHKVLTSSKLTSIGAILRRDGLQAHNDAITRRTRRALDQTSPSLQSLASFLDKRVFVSLVRGLWDLTARKILQFAENLQEDACPVGHAWKGRKNALNALGIVDEYYRTSLSQHMAGSLHKKDLEAPQHSHRAMALLDDTSSQIDMSFNVY